MKKFLNLAVAAAILSVSGVAEARGYDRHHYSDGADHRVIVVQRPRPHMSLQARAQLRLRQLGYYRGPVDGDFGRGSRRALVRFQADRGLAVTGWLDGRTQRALRL